ncbi:hypothetical protein LCGC14_0429530 [marine sediment metagenome]|uniref:Uncharacterized protein n=1 Tax=marine sediment metagenome TaxID=412755 RepID=A0A0F9T6H2_9ZZZZ
MSLEDNTTCALCLVDFVDGDEVRPIHPTQGLVFPTSHTFPDAINIFGATMVGICRDDHTEPHIHEKCINAWEDKFNLKTPATREEAAETAGIPRFSVFSLTDAEYTADEISEIFDSTLDEEDEMEQALIAEVEEEDKEADCPVGCPHKLYLHKEITDQVLLCSLCDCSF